MLATVQVHVACLPWSLHGDVMVKIVVFWFICKSSHCMETAWPLYVLHVFTHYHFYLHLCLHLCLFTLTCLHLLAPPLSHTHAHTHTHARTHTHMHARTHTHTHTHQTLCMPPTHMYIHMHTHCVQHFYFSCMYTHKHAHNLGGKQLHLMTRRCCCQLHDFHPQD